jgi:phosphohistidine phosphatase SixA
LLPEDDPAAAKRLIDKTDKPIILVGHLPHLSALVSALTESSREIQFHTAVVALVKKDAGWQIEWMV